jgi:glutamyl-tRNA synthetase
MADLIRTRFAPSPTGDLHVGGARSALFCWAFARANNGRFLLRIEDTDQKRSSAAAGLGFLDALDWRGIDWDEGPEHGTSGGGDTGPYFQSQRLDVYAQHMQRLIDAGVAYPAFETPDELNAARKIARANKVAYRYNRASLDLDEAAVQDYLDAGKPHVIRFKVPDSEAITIHDAVLGDVCIDAGTLEDFVIRKADGFPTYHFAVVVDDQCMGVTHVLRGQEHLANTPKHVLLQRALGFNEPVYAHVSLIFNADGSKMSKRDKDKALRATVRDRKLDTPPEECGIDAETWATWLGDKTVQLDAPLAQTLADVLSVELPEINVSDFRKAGYLPEVLLNYLALLGWSPGDNIEQFDRAFMVSRFTLDRIIKSPAKFDRAKLKAFNLDAIQAMSTDTWVEKLQAFAEQFEPAFLEAMTPSQFSTFAMANKERCKTLREPFDSGRFFVVDDDAVCWPDVKGVRKALVKGDPCGYERLAAVRDALASIDDWSVLTIESAVEAFAQRACDGNLGKVAQPLRVAVSGGTVSPPIFDTLDILGKTAVLARLDRCLANRLELKAS